MIGRYGPPIFQICRGIEGAYNVALIKAIPKDNIHQDYLYYFLKQKTLLEYIEALSPRTGGQTGVDLVCLKRYPIELPEKSEQQKIANVLSSLDAKIELNNQINAELEGMAKLLYDYWFVQYEFPMTAAQAASLSRPALAGHPYKSSGGKLVPNETLNRPIPADWHSGTLQYFIRNDKTGDWGQDAPTGNYTERVPTTRVCGRTRRRSCNFENGRPTESDAPVAPFIPLSANFYSLP